MNLSNIHKNNSNFSPISFRNDPNIANFFSTSIPSFSNLHIFSNLEFVDLRNQKMTDLFKIIQKNSEIPLVYLCHGKTLQEMQFVFLGDLHGDFTVKKMNTFIALLFCHKKTNCIWIEADPKNKERMIDSSKLPKRLNYQTWDTEKIYLDLIEQCLKIFFIDINEYAKLFFETLYDYAAFGNPFSKKILQKLDDDFKSFLSFLTLIFQNDLLSLDKKLKEEHPSLFLQVKQVLTKSSTFKIFSHAKLQSLKIIRSVIFWANDHIIKIRFSKRQKIFVDFMQKKSQLNNKKTDLWIAGYAHHVIYQEQQMTLEPSVQKFITDNEKKDNFVLLQPDLSYEIKDSYNLKDISSESSKTDFWIQKAWSFMNYYLTEMKKNKQAFPKGAPIPESDYLNNSNC